MAAKRLRTPDVEDSAYYMLWNMRDLMYIVKEALFLTNFFWINFMI